LFPEDVLADAQKVPDHVRPEDKAGRRDLTVMRLVTIDGEDARDFDDAVCIERDGDGFRLGGAIDFDLPEAKIVLREDGSVENIEKRPRQRSHRIVEELMLAANEAVARHFQEKGL